MNDLFVFAAHNTVVALVLALFVCGLTHFWRNPPAAHVIWLLVLVRLVALPVVRLEVFAPRLAELPHARGRETAQESRIEARNDLSQPTFNDLPTSQTTAEASATRNVRDEPAATFPLFWNRAVPLFVGVWIGGAVVCVLVAATRIVRFERRLRDTLPRTFVATVGSVGHSPIARSDTPS